MNKLMFHHIGIASVDIEREYTYFQVLGYVKEGNSFVDETQGIKGQFIIADGQPRIELLQNLEGSHALDIWLNNKTKMYHLAYYVEDFDKTTESFIHNPGRMAKIIVPAKMSVYFGSRIVFLMLPNMSIIELIEAPILISQGE